MNIKNRNDYISLKKELRFNSSDYQDTQVVDMTQKAVDYAYDNLKEPENIYEGYDIEFEAEITDIALSIDAHLQKNKKNKKSHVIRKFILDVINTEKYKKGRSGFIYLLYILKMDDSLKQIAIKKKGFLEFITHGVSIAVCFISTENKRIFTRGRNVNNEFSKRYRIETICL